MPIMVSYSFGSATTTQHNHIQSMFERLGWQQIGGSCYRYPPLSQEPVAEDWLNCVVPALMLFRTYVLAHQIPLRKFSLDAFASTGVDQAAGVGSAPMPGASIHLEPPSCEQFGEQRLREWLDGIATPY